MDPYHDSSGKFTTGKGVGGAIKVGGGKAKSKIRSAYEKAAASTSKVGEHIGGKYHPVVGETVLFKSDVEQHGVVHSIEHGYNGKQFTVKPTPGGRFHGDYIGHQDRTTLMAGDMHQIDQPSTGAVTNKADLKAAQYAKTGGAIKTMGPVSNFGHDKGTISSATLHEGGVSKIRADIHQHPNFKEDQSHGYKITAHRFKDDSQLITSGESSSMKVSNAVNASTGKKTQAQEAFEGLVKKHGAGAQSADAEYWGMRAAQEAEDVAESRRGALEAAKSRTQRMGGASSAISKEGTPVVSRTKAGPAAHEATLAAEKATQKAVGAEGRMVNRFRTNDQSVRVINQSETATHRSVWGADSKSVREAHYEAAAQHTMLTSNVNLSKEAVQAHKEAATAHFQAAVAHSGTDAPKAEVMKSAATASHTSTAAPAGSLTPKAHTSAAVKATHADRAQSPEARNAAWYASSAQRESEKGNSATAAKHHAGAAKHHTTLASMATSDGEREAHLHAATAHRDAASRLGGGPQVIAKGSDLNKSKPKLSAHSPTASHKDMVASMDNNKVMFFPKR
jgi:hypothetical protein